MQRAECLKRSPGIRFRNGQVFVVRFSRTLLGRHAHADAQAQGNENEEGFDLHFTQRRLPVITGQDRHQCIDRIRGVKRQIGGRNRRVRHPGRDLHVAVIEKGRNGARRIRGRSNQDVVVVRIPVNQLVRQLLPARLYGLSVQVEEVPDERLLLTGKQVHSRFQRGTGPAGIPRKGLGCGRSVHVLELSVYPCQQRADVPHHRMCDGPSFAQRCSFEPGEQANGMLLPIQ